MNNWERVIIGPEDSMAKAIEVLDKESQRIVLVAGQERELLGVITDGDIRRALIRSCGMDEPVSNIMSSSPTTASSNQSRENILALMKSKDILHVPVVDEKGRLLGLELLQNLTNQSLYDNPVFIMAGGFGKRLRPLTEDVPKPLLSVGGKPILELIIESFISQGFHNFYLSTHYKAEMIRDYFGDGSDWNVSISYVHEDTPLGTGGALGLLPDDIIDLPILMMNGDLLTKVSYAELIDFHEQNGGTATMCVREYDIEVPYGVVKADTVNVSEIIEKPVHKFFVNAGIYVISPELQRKVGDIGVIDMPELLQQEIGNDRRVNMFPVHEYWLDIGRMEDYTRAQAEVKGLI